MANLDGDEFDDVLSGGAANDELNGLGGGDDLAGGGGDDVLNGGDGSDFLFGNDGDDFIDGGGDFDHAFWSDRGQAFIFTLDGFTNTAVRADGLETDTFQDVEAFDSTEFGDTYNISGGFQSSEGKFVFIQLGRGDDTINAQGVDVAIEYIRAQSGVTVDLGAGIGRSTAPGDLAQVGVDLLTGVDNVSGSPHDDILRGSDSGEKFEVFDGRIGDDFIDGVGGSNNRAVYSSADVGVNVDLVAGTASDGLGGTDTLVNIQHIEGGAHADVISGDGQRNFLNGQANADEIFGLGGDDSLGGQNGDDILSGGAGRDFIAGDDGDDEIDGGSGNDSVDAGAGEDTIEGGTGDDFLRGAAGDDFIGGGANFDTATWTDRGQGFTFTLDGFTNTAVSADGLETDTFERIEGIFGSNFGDTYNATDGFTADDGLFVSLRLGAGDDVITNAGATVRLDYRSADAGVTVDLGLGTGQSTGANDLADVGLDTFSGIDRARGSNHGDILRGSDSGGTFQQFEGRDGADFIDGVGGTNNEARYRFSGSGVNVDLVAGTAEDGTGSTDTLVNIQRIEGSEHADVISGDDVRNILRSRSGDDLLTGLGGNDTLEGGGGDDVLDGGEGDDFFRPSTGDDTGDGGVGFDQADYTFETANAVAFVLGEATQTAIGADIGTDTFTELEAFRGGAGADTFTVEAGYRNNIGFLDATGLLFNSFMGNGGDDVVTGNGATRLEFTSATDGVTVDLAAGTATGDASVGSDTFTGVNSVRSSAFADTLFGSDDPAGVGGRFSVEIFRPGQGADVIDGRGGMDMLAYDFSNNGAAVVADLTLGAITDGFGDVDSFQNIEALSGGEQNDQLFGDAEDNLLRPRGGSDTLDGRGGMDMVLYNVSKTAVTVNLATGVATDGDGNTDSLANIENAEGSSQADQITGDDAANLLIGNSGDDTLNGGDGDDVLEGGDGADTLDGGDGLDLADYGFDGAGVVVDLTAGTATDGGGALDGLISIEGAIGSAFDDLFVNGVGASVFHGGDGEDTVDYSGAATGVTANLSANRITVGAVDDAVTGVENVIGSGANDVLVGDGAANHLMGGEGVDRLDGRGGGDTLEGGGGNDIYTVDSSDDTVIEGAGGGGSDRVNAFADFVNPDNVEFLVGRFANVGLQLTGNGEVNRITGANRINSPDEILGLGGNDKLVGLVGDDVIDGGQGRDRIFGNSGQDVITGGAGADVMTGQQNADTFVFGLGSGVDTITDFTAGVDLIDLTAYDFADFAALDAVLSDIKGRAQINLNGNQDVLRLNGVVEADLDADDFLL